MVAENVSQITAQQIWKIHKDKISLGKNTHYI